ncbi:hypothetical protein F511_14199 [Dorcoceras hygrometricum]|uniref:Uncharacterized protein n=1 Tax=Dorcoceras hygrometricum TaxID=472368 RepID=A0A2Z7D8B5_9LAMI|nr:hypothetical protein F511_14199 [Dorcoceras hygrometricum]
MRSVVANYGPGSNPRPKNLKISKLTKIGPISNIGRKTSWAARDRPELNLEGKISRRNDAGKQDGWRSPPNIARGARPRSAAICAASHARNIAQSCAHPGMSWAARDRPELNLEGKISRRNDAGKQDGWRSPPNIARGARPRSAAICAASHARNIAQSCAHPGMHASSFRPITGSHNLCAKQRYGSAAMREGSQLSAATRWPHILSCARCGAAPCGSARGRFAAVDRQSSPRPDSRHLRQPALEGLTNSARTETPLQADRNKSDHGKRRRRATAGGGAWSGRRRRGYERKGAAVS